MESLLILNGATTSVADARISGGVYGCDLDEPEGEVETANERGAEDHAGEDFATDFELAQLGEKRADAFDSLFSERGHVSPGFLQGLDYGVVEYGADLFDGVIGAVGPGAIGEQRDRKLRRGIDPERCARVAEMAEGVCREMSPGLRNGGGSVPAQSPSGAGGRGLTTGEDGDGFGADDRAFGIDYCVREFSEVAGGGKKSGVRGHAAKDAGVFVLHFSLDNSFAKSAAA